jgi:hypothetical protein
MATPANNPMINANFFSPSLSDFPASHISNKISQVYLYVQNIIFIQKGI